VFSVLVPLDPVAVGTEQLVAAFVRFDGSQNFAVVRWTTIAFRFSLSTTVNVIYLQGTPITETAPYAAIPERC
jgi:hypothetical protein